MILRIKKKDEIQDWHQFFILRISHARSRILCKTSSTFCARMIKKINEEKKGVISSINGEKKLREPSIRFIKERITNAIEPDTKAGEPPLLPIIERFRPKGSTSEVLFRTVRPCYVTNKSHVSHAVLDSAWEKTVAHHMRCFGLSGILVYYEKLLKREFLKLIEIRLGSMIDFKRTWMEHE